MKLFFSSKVMLKFGVRGILSFFFTSIYFVLKFFITLESNIYVCGVMKSFTICKSNLKLFLWGSQTNLILVRYTIHFNPNMKLIDLC